MFKGLEFLTLFHFVFIIINGNFLFMPDFVSFQLSYRFSFLFFLQNAT